MDALGSGSSVALAGHVTGVDTGAVAVDAGIYLVGCGRRMGALVVGAAGRVADAGAGGCRVTNTASRVSNTGASGCGVAASGGVGTVVTVRVDSGVSSVGGLAVVGSVGAFGLLVVLVALDGVLDLVDDGRHDGWLVLVCSC